MLPATKDELPLRTNQKLDDEEEVNQYEMTPLPSKNLYLCIVKRLNESTGREKVRSAADLRMRSRIDQ